MYESCLAVGAVVAADDRDSLADVSFDPLTVAYDEEEDAGDTNGDGYVSSTNNVGCASVSARGSAGLLALAAGLMGLRRRRQGDA